MEEKDLFKKLNEESEGKIPDVYKKVVASANEQGLFNQNTATEEVYSDGETVALGGVNRKAIAITTLAATAAVCLAIALPIALSGKFDGGIPPLAEKPFGSDYAVGAVAATKLAEVYFEGDETARKTAKTASLAVNPDEWGIERYISEFDNYFYACNSFFGDVPATVKYVENHDVKYDNSIIITGKFSNGDPARYAMYYSEARVLDDDTVTGDEVKYYLEGYMCLNDKNYMIVGERVYADSTKEREKSLTLTAAPLNHTLNGGVDMSVEYGADGSVTKYLFNVIKGGEIVSESVLTFPADEDDAYTIEFNGDDGERGGAFTVKQPQEGWDSFSVGYEIGNLKSNFSVRKTASKIERVLAPDGLEYQDNGDGTYTVSGYDKNKPLPEEFIIPAEIDGKKVVKIGASAFSSCPTIERVLIPEGVTEIAEYAFYQSNIKDIVLPETLHIIGNVALGRCNELKGIKLPKSLVNIGAQAFYRSGLVEIELPENVETVGDETFRYCENLKTVLIPASVNSIGDGIFCGTAIENIEVDAANTNYYVEGGCLIEKSTMKVMGGSVGFEVPDGALEIGVKAFYECKHLFSHTLPASVKTINSLAFAKSSIRSIVMKGVQKVGTLAFSDSDLQNIEFAETFTTIEAGALRNCANITALNFPASMTTIGYNVFEGCSSLESITVANGNQTFRSENNCLIDNLGTLVLGCRTSVIPDDGSILAIGNAAFIKCNITGIALPASLVEIKDFAFASSSLTSVVIPENVEFIREFAFEQCEQLESVTLPQSLKAIDAYAFRSSALKSITIPAGVETVGINIFADCAKLTEVIISDGVKNLGSGTFISCESLTSVTLPQSVTVITDATFKNCVSLESVTISADVTEIGEQAFYGCTKLKEINFGSTVEQWGNISFGRGWEWDTGEYTVKCSDGVIFRDGTVQRY